MKFLKFLCFMLLGGAMMMASLLWVSQFFTGEGDVTPVIWLDTDSDSDKPAEPESPWQYE